jgi:hypothetical protein
MGTPNFLAEKRVSNLIINRILFNHLRFLGEYHLSLHCSFVQLFYFEKRFCHLHPSTHPLSLSVRPPAHKRSLILFLFYGISLAENSENSEISEPSEQISEGDHHSANPTMMPSGEWWGVEATMEPVPRRGTRYTQSNESTQYIHESTHSLHESSTISK